MYVSGHIITSVLFSKLETKPLKLSFGVTAAIMITTSLVDADHLFNYRLDDGTASSFALHPLHIYWYLMLGALIVGALICRKAIRPYLLATLLGLGLHYAMDLLADAVHYNLMQLIVVDIAFYIATIFFIKRNLRNLLFLTLALIVPYAVNGFLLYGLDIAVDASPVYHIATILMLGITALFARKLNDG